MTETPGELCPHEDKDQECIDSISELSLETPKEERRVPLTELLNERKKRQAAEATVAELEAEIARLKEAKRWWNMRRYAKGTSVGRRPIQSLPLEWIQSERQEL